MFGLIWFFLVGYSVIRLVEKIYEWLDIEEGLGREAKLDEKREAIKEKIRALSKNGPGEYIVPHGIYKNSLPDDIANYANNLEIVDKFLRLRFLT